MTTTADILRFVETLAPRSMKMEWDQVGLNCGRMDAPVTTVLVALDPFWEACQEAKAAGAQVLLTHHPLLFHQQFLTDETEVGRCALFLIENGIAAINAHTNLDCAPGGVNDALASALGLDNISVLEPMGQTPDGRDYGLLRAGFLPEMALEDFLALVKQRLGCPGLRYVNARATVSHVAVGGGACAGEFALAARAGCDTFVTADAKYNQFWDARAAGLNLIDAGHFYTENPVCRVLAGKLQEAFPELSVKISQNQRDCMKFFR